MASGDQQRGDGAELDEEWQVVPEGELQVLEVERCNLALQKFLCITK